MFADTSAADRYEDVLSVDELEDLIKESPDDLTLKEDLAAALVDRVVYGDDEVGPGSEKDVERLREMLLSLAPDQAVFARAYVAYLDSNDVEAARWLVKYARGDDDESAGESFSPDELYLDVIVPFNGVGQKFWSELAAGLAEIWPDSAAALVVAGYVHQDEDRPADAFDCYDRALQKHADYWIAAWGVAEVYYFEREWQAACHYYETALQSELAREIPSLNFQAGYTYGALKKHKLAESYYRKCLTNDSEFPSARNNLGWALYRQGRFEEALAVFEDCIARNIDGDQPQKNKARTLARLGRFAEAVEVWKRAEPNGRLSENGKVQIARLEAKIKGANAAVVLLDDDRDDEDGSLPEP